MVRKLAIFIAVLIVCSLAFLPFSTAALTMPIQPSSQDSFIWGVSPDENYGYYWVLEGVGMWGGQPSRTLVQFDLSSIPSGSTVSSATLKLYYRWYYGSNPVDRIYWAYRITQSWTEGDGFTIKGVTWSTYDGTNPWATAGGDYTETDGASATVPASYGVWMSWTVTGIVKAWVEGDEPNYGFLIKDSEELGGPYLSSFYSREAGYEYAALRPVLEVTYTPPTEVYYDLTVYVVDASTGNPISGATVTLFGWIEEGWLEWWPDTTDTSGMVQFLDLDEGYYGVDVSKTGYNPGWWEGELTADTEITIRLTPVVMAPVPEFSLPLVAVVSTAAIILFLHKRKLSPNLPH